MGTTQRNLEIPAGGHEMGMGKVLQGLNDLELSLPIQGQRFLGVPSCQLNWAGCRGVKFRTSISPQS